MLSNALYFLTAAVVAAGVMAAPAERASHDCGPLVLWQFCNPYTPKQFTGQYTIRPVLNWQLAVTSPWADGSMWSTLILREPSLVNQSFWLDGTGKATQIQYKNYNPPQPPPPGTPLCIGSGLCESASATPTIADDSPRPSAGVHPLERVLRGAVPVRLAGGRHMEMGRVHASDQVDRVQ